MHRAEMHQVRRIDPGGPGKRSSALPLHGDRERPRGRRASMSPLTHQVTGTTALWPTVGCVQESLQQRDVGAPAPGKPLLPGLLSGSSQGQGRRGRRGGRKGLSAAGGHSPERPGQGPGGPGTREVSRELHQPSRVRGLDETSSVITASRQRLLLPHTLHGRLCPERLTWLSRLTPHGPAVVTPVLQMGTSRPGS